ncbi:hypothetical protein PR048_007213 [Dryococelus australis]|uniref:Uncharacterized protein n=1 Tax=Dryococelus australis TaxID=614101 RepID=A0ABQ9ID58_9NEOP|nr:hypothetical protein PR048_007213 [Dryococelus australis]
MDVRGLYGPTAPGITSRPAPETIAERVGAVVNFPTRVREDVGSKSGPAILISVSNGFPKSLQANGQNKNDDVVGRRAVVVDRRCFSSFLTASRRSRATARLAPRSLTGYSSAPPSSLPLPSAADELAGYNLPRHPDRSEHVPREAAEVPRGTHAEETSTTGTTLTSPALPAHSPKRCGDITEHKANVVIMNSTAVYLSSNLKALWGRGCSARLYSILTISIPSLSSSWEGPLDPFSTPTTRIYLPSDWILVIQFSWFFIPHFRSVQCNSQEDNLANISLSPASCKCSSEPKRTFQKTGPRTDPSGHPLNNWRLELLASHQGEPGLSPVRSVLDFRKWESCRTMPLVGEYSRGSPEQIAKLSLDQSQHRISSSNEVLSEEPLMSRLRSKGFGMRSDFMPMLILWDYVCKIKVKDKIDAKHVYTEVDLAIGSQFIRHTLDDFGPTADLQACPPPTKAIRVQSPHGHSGFFHAGGFSRGSPVPPAPSFQRRTILTSSTLIGSQALDVKSRPNLFTLSLTPDQATDLLTNSQCDNRTEHPPRRRHRGANPRPSDCRSATLPLSYEGRAESQLIVLRRNVRKGGWLMWRCVCIAGQAQSEETQCACRRLALVEVRVCCRAGAVGGDAMCVQAAGSSGGACVLQGRRSRRRRNVLEGGWLMWMRVCVAGQAQSEET